MAANDKNDLIITLGNNVQDNNTGQTSNAKIRTPIEQVITHSLNQRELTEQAVDGPVNFASGLKKGGVDVETVKAGFQLKSTVTTSVPSDQNAAAFIVGLEAIGALDGFVLDATIGAIQNNTGRTIPLMAGPISVNPSKTGGSSSQLNLFSETSADKTAWIKNAESARSDTILNAGQTLLTKPSIMEGWASGDWLRFRMFASDNTLSIVAPSFTADSVLISGRSFEWILKEI